MTDVKTETPTVELTLAPTLDAAPVPTLANMSGDALARASDAAEVPAKLDDSMLTEEEKKMVESFSQQINVRDTAMVLQYGAGAQKKMADFSDTALESVRTKDLGEVGGLLSDAVTELRSFDATEEKGLFGFFKKGANKIESLRALATHDPAPTSSADAGAVFCRGFHAAPRPPRPAHVARLRYNRCTLYPLLHFRRLREQRIHP